MQVRFAWIACVGLALASYFTLAPQTKSKKSKGVQAPFVFAHSIATPATRTTLATRTPTTRATIQLVSYEAPVDDAHSEVANHWPVATSLVEQVEMVESVPEMQRWSQETLNLLKEISATQPADLRNLLSHLEVQSQMLPQITTRIWNRANRALSRESAAALMQQHCDVSRLGYRLNRRLAVWNQLSQKSGQSDSIGGRFSDSPFRTASIGRISFEHLDQQWIGYLQLEDLKSAFNSLNPDASQQRSAARKVLARIYSPCLRPDQAAYIKQIMDPELVKELRNHASEPVDQNDLLERIENYEASPSALTGYYLNDHYQNMLWSNDPSDQALASEIQTHYRNANFRIAVSERLLNRMVPKIPSTASPVSQNVKGARVSGQSQVSNELRIDLVQNPDQIVLNLATMGQVQSDTIARTNTFRVQNRGEAEFQVVKPIRISPRGIDSSAKPYALSSGNQSVVGLESKLDDIPIVGWMARKLAAKKLREDAPETDMMFEQTVKNSAESQMQQQVEQQISKIRYNAYTNLYQPLLAMELEPEAVQMATTHSQMVMRYRLAGRDQMAAHTARPRDTGTSLMSFQIHETAINNSIARIGLNGESFTIDELTEHLRGVLGAEKPAADEPNDQFAEIEFAPLDPIHVAFKDDRLNITLNLMKFKVGEDGKEFKRISMTAAYKLNVNGMHITLEQDDDGTRMKGQRRLTIADRLAISTIMKVMFKKEYSINALPKQMHERLGGQALEISQLVVSDGWLAVSIDDGNPRSASSDDEASRIGAIRRLIKRR